MTKNFGIKSVKENEMIEDEQLSTFNWKELDNKNVRVIVTEESGVQVAALYDPESQEFFIVSVKESKSETI